MDEDELKRRTKRFALQVMALVGSLPITTVGRAIGGQSAGKDQAGRGADGGSVSDRELKLELLPGARTGLNIDVSRWSAVHESAADDEVAIGLSRERARRAGRCREVARS